MVDPVQHVAQQAAQQAAESQTQQPTEAVDAKDAAQFDAAMQDGSPSTDAAQPGVNTPQDVQAADQPKTIGDAILDGIEGAKKTYDTHAEKISTQLEATGDEGMSVQDAMKLQYELMQMNLQQEMTTKVADKTSQGVQTLFKNQ